MKMQYIDGAGAGSVYTFVFLAVGLSSFTSTTTMDFNVFSQAHKHDLLSVDVSKLVSSVFRFPSLHVFLCMYMGLCCLVSLATAQ